MAITTRIARSYTLRMNIIAIVCVVLGIWGVVDYARTIPIQELEYREYEVLETVRDSLETEIDDPEFGKRRESALNIVTDRLDAIILRASPESSSDVRSVADPQQVNWVFALFAQTVDELQLPEEVAELPEAQNAKAVIEAIQKRSEEANKWFNPETARDYDWFRQLLLFNWGLRQRPTQPPEGWAAQAGTVAAERLGRMGSRKKPGEYDRWIKGLLFVPCLPFALYFWWLYFRAKARVYRLDDDGTLHMPDGNWAKDDIADIDMKKWMAKSIAHVVHTDGTRVKLDDYLYRNLHLIIGSIAHRFYPEDWTEEAKPFEPEEEEDEADLALAEEALAADDDDSESEGPEDVTDDEYREEEPEDPVRE